MIDVMYYFLLVGNMKVLVATTVLRHEDPELVVMSVRKIFPDWTPEDVPSRRSYPDNSPPARLISEVEGIEYIIQDAKAHKILDTALDAMTLNSENDMSYFSLSRTAAAAGRCSFVVDDYVVGGTIDVTISTKELNTYLTELTSHPGREEYPRAPNDEISMTSDGDPSHWFSPTKR